MVNISVHMEPDPEEFGKALKREVMRDAQEGLIERGTEMQQRLDAIFDSHHGQPAEEVEAALRSAFGDALTDEHYSAFSKGISEGRRVQLEVKPLADAAE